MIAKVSDISAVEVSPDAFRCSENLCCPTNSNPIVNKFYKLRYGLIRFLSVGSVSAKTFIIGGKSFIEVLILLLIFGAGLFLTLTSGALGSGSCASWVAGMGVLLGLRNNPLTLVFGISFERALFWHKFVCLCAIAFAIVHGILAGSSATGITLICMMGGTSLIYLAKYYCFELFYVMHVLFLAGIAAVAFLHSATTFGICVLVWCFDVAVRYVLLGRRIDATAEVLPAGVVKLTFPKPFKYSAGQFVFVMVPNLSQYQYHPFTISSAPHEDLISLHIRTLGDWTTALSAHILKETQNRLNVEVPLTIHLEGPYGHCSVDLNDPLYKVVLLIAGGIGVTVSNIFSSLLAPFLLVFSAAYAVYFQ